MASMMTDRPGVVSTMSAAARAASVAPETAMPQSAFFSAGASFTPSPVMPTMWPSLLQDLDDVELVLREHLREAVGLLDRGRDLPARGLVSLASPKHPGVQDVGAEAENLGSLPGDGDARRR